MIHRIASIVCVLALASMASANLISNNSFETGDLTDWQSTHITTTVAAGDATDGTYAMVYAPGLSVNVAQVIDGALLADGATVTVSFDLWSDRPSGGGKFFARFYADGDGALAGDLKGDGSLLATSGDIYDGTSPGSWQNYSFDVDLGSEAYYVLWLHSEAGPATNYKVDNVVVTPEPASLALLGAGGLAMFRRRRHA